MKLVLATRNPGKLRELQDMLDGIGIEIISAAAAGVHEDVEEDGKTLRQNALKKAKTIRDIVNLPTVADDTGLFINALDGRPGIYSARWAGEGADRQGDLCLFEGAGIPRATLLQDGSGPSRPNPSRG